MLFNKYKIFLIILLFNFAFSFNNNEPLKNNLRKTKNELYKNNVEEMNFRRFLGKWNVYYTNIYKPLNVNSLNIQKHNCLSFYYYFDDSKQFMYKFTKKDNENNLIEKNGNIHIKDLNQNHIWNITNDNKEKQIKDFENDFTQMILYVDPNYRLAIISDNKKDKISIIGRNINNEIKDINNIKYILNNNNLPSFESFIEINHNNCE